jgi:U3 small nucleolar RNA-associated protein 3
LDGDEDADFDAGAFEMGPRGDGGFDSDDGAGYDLYAAAQQRSNANKLAKRSRKQSKVGMTRVPLEEEQVAGKRQINYQIEKNRGLTPRRNKDLKNPRKKHRIKYGKALISRRGQVQDQRERRDGYGGEATGIKTRVTKSVKL